VFLVYVTTTSEAQMFSVVKFETKISFDLDIRTPGGQRQVTLGAGACASQNTSTSYIVSNNGSHNASTSCSTYNYGQPNSLRCDYDDKACETCACECVHAACSAFVCGDGIVNGDEECDLGLQESLDDTQLSDGCSNDCKVQCGWTCPQHCQGDWWECDPVYKASGVELSAIPGTCEQNVVCGDGLIVLGREGCDDGNRDIGDGCDGNCILETNYENKGRLYDCNNVFRNDTCPGLVTICTTICGDSIRSPVEQCDDGNRNNDDGCDTKCIIESGWKCTSSFKTASVCEEAVCGDGAREAEEECDDANVQNGDGCNQTCHIEDAWVCPTAGGTSTSICLPNPCGNGIRSVGEECDDENRLNGDGCSQTCTVENMYSCNTRKNESVDECDVCGNGILVFGEECDDGNRHIGDGCSLACQIESGWSCYLIDEYQFCNFCGDGELVDAEACDDGNLVPGDGCDETCKIEFAWQCPRVWFLQTSICSRFECGNSIREEGEECDDNNDLAEDGCSACMIIPGWRCIDHEMHPTWNMIETNENVKTFKAYVGEVPPPGHPLLDIMPMSMAERWPHRARESWCGRPRCGDWLLDAGEQCDDGAWINNDGCSSACTVENGWDCNASVYHTRCVKRCGDGLLQFEEECDDGNTESMDGCSPFCAIEHGWKCNNTDTIRLCTLRCGDGSQDSDEECDDSNLNNGDGCGNTCNIECGWTCLNGTILSPPSTCTPTGCGDHWISESEECDDGNLISGDGCSSSCHYEDFFSCRREHLVKHRCPGNVSVCIPVCGDGTRVGVEECDDGNNLGNDGCDALCTIEKSNSSSLMATLTSRGPCAGAEMTQSHGTIHSGVFNLQTNGNTAAECTWTLQSSDDLTLYFRDLNLSSDVLIRTCTDYTCTSIRTQSLFVNSDELQPTYTLNGQSRIGTFQFVSFKSNDTSSIQFLQIAVDALFVGIDTSFTANWVVTKRTYSPNQLTELRGDVTQSQWAGLQCGDSTPVGSLTSAFGTIRVHPYFNGFRCTWYITSSADIIVHFLQINIGAAVSIHIEECLDAMCDDATGNAVHIFQEAWTTDSMLYLSSIHENKYQLHSTTGFVRVRISANANPGNVNAAFNGVELMWRLLPRTIFPTTTTTTTPPPSTTTETPTTTSLFTTATTTPPEITTTTTPEPTSTTTPVPTTTTTPVPTTTTTTTPTPTTTTTTPIITTTPAPLAVCLSLADLHVRMNESPSKNTFVAISAQFSHDDRFILAAAERKIQSVNVATGETIDIISDDDLRRGTNQAFDISTTGDIYLPFDNVVVRYVYKATSYTREILAGSLSASGRNVGPGDLARFSQLTEIALVHNQSALVLIDQSRSLLRLLDMTSLPIRHSFLLQATTDQYFEAIAAVPNGSYFVFFDVQYGESLSDGMDAQNARLRKYDLSTNRVSVIDTVQRGSLGVLFSGNSNFLFTLQSYATDIRKRKLVAYDTSDMSRVNLSESATTTYTTDTQQRMFCSHGPPGTCVVNSFGSNVMGALVTTSDLIDAPCLASTPTLRHLLVCGDGFLAPDEECDDGNTQFGDGCWNCKIQCGWICTPGLNASKACKVECSDTFDSCVLNCTKDATPYYDTCHTVCGDGIGGGIEECDDNNLVDRDGCSSECKIELGWTCPWTRQGTACARSDCSTVCGDGIRTPDEECDDGNMLIWDGCTADCMNETVFEGGIAQVSCSGTCDCQEPPFASMGVISYERVQNTNASACVWVISSASAISLKFSELALQFTDSLLIERCWDPTCRNPQYVVENPWSRDHIYTSETGFMRIVYREAINILWMNQLHLPKKFALTWQLSEIIPSNVTSALVPARCNSNVTSGLYYNVGCDRYQETTPFSWNAFCRADHAQFATCSTCPCECASSCRVPTYNASVTCRGGCPCDPGRVALGEFRGYVDDGPGFGPASLNESRPHQGFRCEWLISSLAAIEFAVTSVDLFGDGDVWRFPITQSLEVTLIVQTCRDITCRFPTTALAYTFRDSSQPLPSLNCTTGFLRIIIQSNMEWYRPERRQYSLNGYEASWKLSEMALTPLSSFNVFENSTTSCVDSKTTSGLFGNVGCVQYSNATLDNWNAYCQADNDLYETCRRCPCVCGCPVCGNAKLEVLEYCDDGNDISSDGCNGFCETELGWMCSSVQDVPSSCSAICGDGLVLGKETCDDRNLLHGDGCSAVCETEVGWNCLSGQACTTICGDGRILSPETCDDGNLVDFDGCSSGCRLENGWTCNALQCTAICGDKQVRGQEQCDDGQSGSGDGCYQCLVEEGWNCTSFQDLVSSVCTPACGDGKQRGTEQCDDGNVENSDGCSSACAMACGYNCLLPGSPCVAALCGDGMVAGFESCDDGNSNSGDGCWNCAIEKGFICNHTLCAASQCFWLHGNEVCGDGFTLGAELYVVGFCDDANNVAGDGCSAHCSQECGYYCTGGTALQMDLCDTLCGDSLRADSEACDDGNTNAGDGCNKTCHVEIGYYCLENGVCTHSKCHAVCGDGRMTANETCDDSNTVSGDGCSDSCVLECGYDCQGAVCQTSCGDGVLAGMESCDDGNLLIDDGCNQLCQVELGSECHVVQCGTTPCESKCADGFKTTLEECDDGNMQNGDGCSSACQLECGYSCSASLTPGTNGAQACATMCGDGIRAGAEECDDNNVVSGDRCDSVCQIEVNSQCVVGSECGSSTCTCRSDLSFKGPVNIGCMAYDYDWYKPHCRVDDAEYQTCTRCACQCGSTCAEEYMDNPTCPAETNTTMIDSISNLLRYTCAHIAATDQCLYNKWKDMGNATACSVCSCSCNEVCNPAEETATDKLLTRVMYGQKFTMPGSESWEYMLMSNTVYNRGVSGTGRISSDMHESEAIFTWTIQSLKQLTVIISRVSLRYEDKLYWTRTSNNHESCPPNNWCGENEDTICASCTTYSTLTTQMRNDRPCILMTTILPIRVVSDEGIVQLVVRRGNLVDFPRYGGGSQFYTFCDTLFNALPHPTNQIDLEWSDSYQHAAVPSSFAMSTLPSAALQNMVQDTTTVTYSDLLVGLSPWDDLVRTPTYPMSRAVYTTNAEQSHGEINSGGVDSKTVASWIIQSSRILVVRITSVHVAQQTMAYTSTTQNHEFCPPNVWCGPNRLEVCAECTTFTQLVNYYDTGLGQWVAPILPDEIVSEQGIVQIVIKSRQLQNYDTFSLEWHTIDTVALPVELPMVQTCDIRRKIPEAAEKAGGQLCEAFGIGICERLNVCEHCPCNCDIKFCASLSSSRRLLQVEDRVNAHVFDMMPMTTRNTHAFNMPPRHQPLPVLELALRQQIGGFLNINTLRIGGLEYLHTSFPLYRRASFTIVSDTLQEDQRVLLALSVNNFIAVTSAASNHTAIVRNMVTESNLISAVACLAGSYLKSDLCLECPANSHSPVYSTSITSCVCNDGWSGANGDVCTQCGAGKYKSEPQGVTSSCEMCPLGKFKPFL